MRAFSREVVIERAYSYGDPAAVKILEAQSMPRNVASHDIDLEDGPSVCRETGELAPTRRGLEDGQKCN